MSRSEFAEFLAKDTLKVQDVQVIVDGVFYERETLHNIGLLSAAGPVAAKGAKLTARTGLNLEKLAELFTSNKAGIKLCRIDRFIPDLQKVATAYHQSCYGYMTANAYFAPENLGEFYPLHRDEYDIVIMQISGKKTFYTYDLGVDETDTANERKFLLSAGDIFLLPARTPHYARPAGEESLHMTLGFHPLKLKGLLQFAEADEMVQTIKDSQLLVESHRVPSAQLMGYFERMQSLLNEPTVYQNFIASQKRSHASNQ